MTVAQVIPDIERIKKIAESNLLTKIVLCQPIRGGRNSRVYRLESSDGQNVVSKFYYQDKQDARDRLGVEFSSLQFLWNKGLRSIPQPLMCDLKNACAIYQYVQGENLRGQEITKAQMDQLLKFIADLQNIKKDIPVGQFFDASEACFSMEQILSRIDRRRKRLEGIDHAGLQDFLKDFDITLREFISWAKQKADDRGVSWEMPIEQDKSTLSPSDLGFHNALETKDGRVVFCDFEYFGWDNPVKVIIDLLFHPGMKLTEEIKLYFISGMEKIFFIQKDIRARLEVSYPLFGMQWCLILLNEFLSQDLSRRVFADQTIDREALLAEQLTKAKGMLIRIKSTYRNNPYA